MQRVQQQHGKTVSELMSAVLNDDWGYYYYELLENPNIDVNQCNPNSSVDAPLLYVVIGKKNLAALRALLSHQLIDVTIKNLKGESALDIAVGVNNAAAVQELLPYFPFAIKTMSDALSYRDLTEMALERGLKLERSTICHWVQEYASAINKRMKPHLKMTCDSWKLDETYVKIKGEWHYLYRAIDKHGDTLDWMLSYQRNKKAAKRFFKKLLGNKHTVDPRVINVDKSPTFPPALDELKATNEVPKNTKLRSVKYLNNSVENDHKSTKSKSRYRQWYQSFSTARNTLDGMEAMRRLKKGQVRNIGKNIAKQNSFVCSLFAIAA